MQRNTLNCITRVSKLKDEIKDLEPNDDGVKRLKDIRNRRLFEFRKESTLIPASGHTKHRQQSRGFGNIKKVNTKRAKAGDEKSKDTKQLIEEGVKEPIKDDCWGRLTHFPDMMYLRSLLAYHPEEQREIFLSKIKPAQKLWACSECKTYDADKYDGNYVRCDTCNGWVHFKCTGLEEMPEEEEEEEKWYCSKCVGSAQGSPRGAQSIQE